MVKRIVVKVGTSTLTGGNTNSGGGTASASAARGLDRVYINSLAAQIAAQRSAGRQVVLVSSGAIQAGLDTLKRTERPRTIPEKQAAASIGQSALMALYADIFANYGIPVGQVLLTRDDLRHRARYVNARNTFEALLALRVLPIVNENDTVATEEIRVGDNDTLAALVASLLNADALLLLSDVNGLYDRNPAVSPDARLVERVERIDDAVRAMASGGAGTPSGTGGMQTKLAAAEIATRSGAQMWIAPGRRSDVIADCLAQKPGTGTYFAPVSSARPSARKRWIAWGSGEPAGTIFVNTNARRALEEEGRSLLAVGIVGVSGSFQAGELVAVAEQEEQTAFARGFSHYGAGDVARIAGCPTPLLASALGLAPDAPAPVAEVIHRDQLVLLPAPPPASPTPPA